MIITIVYAKIIQQGKHMEKLFHSSPIYQIYPRSFCDSNGDGIGDIQGIISKLDYLRDLGVKILWLSPIYKSPLFDMGYDVADYYSIHPDYGTMEDFDELLEEAKKRDMRIVMDLVVNHTSSEHEWFKRALKGEQPYHDYYVFKKGKGPKKAPNNWSSMFTGSAWKYVEGLDEWYLHLYAEQQPDLNWHNEDVVQEVEKILRFYLDKGVYGFRCDVINQIYKESYEDGKGIFPSGRGQEHYLMTEGNHRILRRFYDDVFSHYDCVVIGETFNVDVQNGLRFIQNRELDMFFTFEHMDVTKKLGGAFTKKFKPQNLKKVLYSYQKSIPWNANYFENHDQQRSIEKFGDFEHHRAESAKALATILLTLRGTPFIYQGEELGTKNGPAKDPSLSQDCSVLMINELCRKMHLPKALRMKITSNLDRDRCRAMMPWSEEDFGKPAWLPATADEPSFTAEEETKCPDSIYSYYKKLIALRYEREELTKGSFEPVEAPAPLFIYQRVFENKRMLIVVNLSSKWAKLPAGLPIDSAEALVEQGSIDEKGRISPYGARVFAIK